MNGVVVALSAALGGILTAVVAALAARGRTKSEAQHIEAQAVDVISRAAADFVERSTAASSRQEAKLEAKIAELEAKIKYGDKAPPAGSSSANSITREAFDKMDAKDRAAFMAKPGATIRD